MGRGRENRQTSALRHAVKATQHNRSVIEASAACGCAFCGQVFGADEVVRWDGPDSDTAECPRCGCYWAVIGDASGFPIDPEFLSQVRSQMGSSNKGRWTER